jgi:hypothetical protein
MESIVDNALTDKNTSHSYLPVYESLFSPFRETCTNVLEVGVFDGGSMKLWHDYFPNANIYGFDLSLARNRYVPPPRVHLSEEDAYKTEVVARFEPESFDIVMDDGWHSLESMCSFAALYHPLVRPGGYLIVEDLQAATWGDAIRPHLPDSMECQVIDRVAVKGRHDDILFVARKPLTNPGPAASS